MRVRFEKFQKKKLIAASYSPLVYFITINQSKGSITFQKEEKLVFAILTIHFYIFIGFLFVSLGLYE